jgi:thiol-disulfide isomerase/thioredoxin
MTKRILFLMLLVSNTFFAQIIFENSLAETFEKAKKENKAVFIEFYNQTCHHCQKVAPFLDSKEVGDAYNPIFVSYKINTYDGLTKEEEDFLTQHKLFFTDVPNFVYFDKNEKFLHHASGKPDPQYIINKTTEAFDPKIQSSNLSNRVKNGDKSLGTLYQYSLLAQLNQNKVLADSIANVLYEVYDKKNLSNDTSYIILKNAVFTTKNGFFKYWVANPKRLKNMDAGEFKGHEVDLLKNIISIDLTDTDFDWTPQSTEDIYKYIIATNYTTKPENVLVNKRILFFNKKDPSKDISSYFTPILDSDIYQIDDKIYILETLNENFKDKKSKKIIKKFASELKAKAALWNNNEAEKQINKIIKSS